jgi:hypothetical protein
MAECPLFDGKPLSENFRRNRQEGNLESQERWTEPTSTNIVFGVTFKSLSEKSRFDCKPSGH